MSEEKTVLDAYKFHGVVFSSEGDNSQAACPFCMKEKHFYVAKKTGQYNCRRCQASGNLYTFLEHLHATSKKQTKPTTKAIVELAADRNLDPNEILEWGICVSYLDDSFLIPMHNVKGKLANLGRIVKVKTAHGPKWVAYGTPTCKMNLFGLHLLEKRQTNVFLCEGPWDGIALRSALKRLRQTESGSWQNHIGDQIAIKSFGVVSTPGCGTFHAEWLQKFGGCNIIVLYDNDHPKKDPVTGRTYKAGWDGMQRVVKITNETTNTVKSLKHIVWGKGGYEATLASGYDVRDLLKERKAAPALNHIMSRLSSEKLDRGKTSVATIAASIEPAECQQFDDLCEQYDKFLYFPETFRATLAVATATVVSTPLQGEQLFFRMVGPPGSGKTTIAECLSVAKEYCFPKSILTGWHSGIAAQRAEGREEPSLVPQMNGKCVIIKDADTLIQAGNRDKILAELRDLYDGVSRAQYRTGKKQDFEDLRTSFLLCGTDALRGLNRTFLGERFLDCDILGDSDTHAYLDTATNSAFDILAASLQAPSEETELSGKPLQVLKAYTYGYLRHLRTSIEKGMIKAPRAEPEAREKIQAMAEFLSFMRARVERDRDELAYRPRVELATRLVKQFVKLAGVVAITINQEEIEDATLSICRRVMGDSSYGYPFEITNCISQHAEGRAVWHIASAIRLSESTIRRTINDMVELGIVETKATSNKSHHGGADSHLYVLSPTIIDLFNKANF